MKNNGDTQFEPIAYSLNGFDYKKSPKKMETQLMEQDKKTREESLGPFFSLLDDELMMDLFAFFDERTLVSLSMVSRVMNIFSEEEELWKDLCIRKWVNNKIGNFSFKGNWKRTCILPKDKTMPFPPKRISVNGFYSTRLFKKWYRAHVPLSNFDMNSSTIEKRHNLSYEEFVEEYESKNKPVIICGAIDHWKARNGWTIEKLLEVYGDTHFKTNGTDDDGRTFRMTVKDYVTYMNNHQDDKPIYVFDNKFLERAPNMVHDFEVPVYFKEDMFEYMDPIDRPDWRWILMGPARSGSPFHTDPHRTSAWNALLVGRKRWTLYPPNVIPPGVDEELIDSEYYASPDVMKYFMEVYPYIHPNNRPMEGILEEGEIIFVPSGWWHQVLNLTNTVAVTQNFCSSRNFPLVFEDFIQKKSRTLKKDFIRAVYPRYPELFRQWEPIDRHLQEADSSSEDSSSNDDSSSTDSD